MDIGNVLAQARKAHGIKQGDLADAMGISRTYLADIEAGRRNLPDDRVKDIPKPLQGHVAAALAGEYYAKAEALRGLIPRIGECEQLLEGGEV